MSGRGTLLYLHNLAGPLTPDAADSPMVVALRTLWDGPVVIAHDRDVTIRLPRTASGAPAQQPVVSVRGIPVEVQRCFSRSFQSPYGTVLKRSLEALGIAVHNSAASAALVMSKFETALVLAGAGYPVLDQYLLCSDAPAAVGELRYGQLKGGAHDAGLAQLAGGWPIVVKADDGFGGHQVFLAGDRAAVARAVRGGDGRTGDGWVAQEFRRDADNCDVRVLVAGGAVVAAMLRTAPPGDFRSNLTQGGRAEPVTLTPAERAISVGATATVGLTVCGVDLLRTTDGPLVTELNGLPALIKLVEVCGPQVYTAIAAAVTA
jgi:ribosomal protein S6--L-glutamate ligase